MTEEKKITSNQRKAIESLLTGATRAEAAAFAGIGEKTLYRWQHDPVFTAALRSAENEALTNAQAGLISRIEENLIILDEIKRDKENAPGARIRAIQLELDTLIEWRNLAILEARITEIENRLESAGV